MMVVFVFPDAFGVPPPSFMPQSASGVLGAEGVGTVIVSWEAVVAVDDVVHMLHKAGQLVSICSSLLHCAAVYPLHVLGSKLPLHVFGMVVTVVAVVVDEVDVVVQLLHMTGQYKRTVSPVPPASLHFPTYSA